VAVLEKMKLRVADSSDAVEIYANHLVGFFSTGLR
jgi:hypothetical protein